MVKIQFLSLRPFSAILKFVGLSLMASMTCSSCAQAQDDEPGAVATPSSDAGVVGKKRFEEMDRAHRWQEAFFDAGTGDSGATGSKTIGWKDGVWKKNWFLDGEIASVANEKQGMHLHAGPRWKDDAHHMVLWTKQEFAGDLKIEYEFTRTDMEDVGSVIMLYIQATGDGSQEFPEDITQWSDKRTVPGMGTYFRNMNLYHISYSVGSPFISGNPKDYMRARRYMPDGDTLRGTNLPDEYADTGLWKPGVTYRMTILKTDREIAIRVKGPEETKYFTFKNEKLPPITHGRIGLRHMYTRSARYKDFRVSVVAPAQ